ncbi:putative LysR family transcriptional regulator [Gordonia soli NBRC 108243]|uniref:Putative LysR family transcriptional regulator n=1 Tax=Gordonia soli NBRC 108243 TaxID=1223545 RepID=M0QLH7_9ACTN|nr:putative LysR family transcriptional regulator [Gordonia soli NBRC 108243]
MFVTAVDAPTLSAAAEELFITQQALSAAIRELERQLDVSLFSRTRRSLTLTPAGHALYRGAVPLLAGGRQLARMVRRADAGRPDPFVIGHTPDVATSEIFQIIESVVLADASVPITARPVFAESIREDLLAGTIDIALARGVQPPSDLASTIATYHALRLAVDADHPLAQQDSVTIEDLAPHPIVVWGPEHESYYTDVLVSHCRRAGFDPTLIVSTLLGTPPHTAVVAHPDACAFVTNDPGWVYGNRIRIMEFTDPPLVPVQAMWLPHTASELRNRILAAGEESGGAGVGTAPPLSSGIDADGSAGLDHRPRQRG